MQGKARILVYGFPGGELRRIDGGLASLGIPPCLKAGPGQLATALRRILAEQGGEETGGGSAAPCPPAPGGEADQERLVLFHNLSDAGVQELMRFFRQTVAGRPIFAVSTPTSIEWTLGELLAHLVQERAALG